MPRRFSSRKRRASTKWRPITKKKAMAQVGRYNRTSLAAARRYRATNMRSGGLLGVETKFLDMSVSAGVIPVSTNWTGTEFDPAASGTTGCLNCPAQGDGAQNRDGLKFICKSLEIEGTILCTSQTAQTTADIVPEVLIAVILDSQTNGAQAQGEDTYGNLGGNAVLSSHPLRNMTNSSRIKVLKKKLLRGMMPTMVNVGATPTTFEQTGYTIPFKMFIPLNNMVVKCTTGGTTADVANIVDNSIHLIANASNITLAPTIYYNARLRFVG